MLRQRVVMIAGLVILAASAGCGGFRGVVSEIGDLQRLQQQLQQQTGQNDIAINLNNGGYLSVRLVNSPWKNLPADQKQAKSLELARLAYNDWPKRADLDSVSVTYETHQSVGPLYYDNAMDTTEFTISQLTSTNDAPRQNNSR
jgi:hypothetical protein